MSMQVASPAAWVLIGIVAATQPGTGLPPLDEHLLSENAEESAAAVEELRAMLAASPRQTVERLNARYMGFMFQRAHYAAIEEFAITGSIAVARDTWPVEQLQRSRVLALRKAHKPQEALSAAKALFNVSGLGSTQHCIRELCDCLREAHPDDPGIVYRFKLQQLAGAQTDPEARRGALADTGERILDKIEIDPKPYEEAIEKLKDRTDYDSMYARGNLLLLAGRTKEARELFERIYKTAPAKELPYAAEGLAKAIKAEDGAIGRCNAFILSIRPKQ